MELDAQVKAAYCRLIASLVAADEVVTEEEERFLKRTIERLGLSDEDLTAALQVVDTDEAAATLAELPEVARRAIVQQLVDAAYADGHYHPAESANIARVAEVLGLSGDVPGPSGE